MMAPGGTGTLRRLRRGWSYLLDGTLGARLACRWRDGRRGRRRAEWARRAAGAEYLEAEVHPGVRMRLYLDDELSRAIYCEDFEWQERRFLAAFLRPGEVFVDVGANIGLFTLIAARRVGPAGRVFAIEPNPRSAARLKANVTLNGLTNVSCEPLALSDRGGQATLTVALEGHEAWSSLGRPIAGGAVATEAVPCVTWDDFARDNGLAGRVAMMKIDVEGWERRVLDGGRETLARPDAPLLQVEFIDAASEAAGSSCAAVYAALEALGYRMFVYDGFSGRLVPDPPRVRYPYLNLIAAKRPAQVAERLARPGRGRPW